jgi:hypothetical protein
MCNHGLSARDLALLAAFESGELPPAEFSHRAHVVVAYAYLAQDGVEAAAREMRRGLMGYLAHHRIDPSKYHETLTRAWILAVWHFMQRTGPTGSSDELIERNPLLLDGKIMLTHYSAELLFSPEARATFVEPDLDPIPRHPDGSPKR